jgi:hypothetical protein
MFFSLVPEMQKARYSRSCPGLAETLERLSLTPHTHVAFDVNLLRKEIRRHAAGDFIFIVVFLA